MDGTRYCTYCGGYVPDSEVDSMGRHSGGNRPCHYLTGILCTLPAPPHLPALDPQTPLGLRFGRGGRFTVSPGAEPLWEAAAPAIRGEISVAEMRRNLDHLLHEHKHAPSPDLFEADKPFAERMEAHVNLVRKANLAGED